MVFESRHRSLVAAVILALATLVCFHRLTMHPLDVLVGSHDGGRTDLVGAYGAMKTFQRDALKSGQWPLWDPHILCGLPMLGNPQAAMFYPPNWVLLVGNPLQLMSWMLLVHHWFAGFGTFLLARRYRLTYGSALLAGIVFSTAPFMVAATAEGHYNQTGAVSWIPWALLGYERLRTGRRHGIPLTAAALAMSFLCGHAQETFYLFLVITSFVAADLLGRDVPGRVIPRVALLKRWSTVGATVVGLVSFELLPIWFYTKQAVRASGISLDEASTISLSLASLWQLIDPFALGDGDTYRGPGQFYWETVCHFGGVALLLALVGCASGLRQNSVRRLAILAVVTLLFAFGSRTPVFAVLHGYLPGISFFRAPARALYFCSFAVAMLAGFGMDRVVSACSRLPRRRIFGTVACGFGVTFLVLMAVGARTTSDMIQVSQMAAISITWPLGVTSCVLGVGGVVLLKPEWTMALCVICLGAILAEATRHAHHVTGTIPPDQLRVRNEVVDFIAHEPGVGRLIASQRLVSDREACNGKLLKFGGLEGVPLARPALAIVSLMKAKEPVSQLTGFAATDLAEYPRELLDLTAVSHAVVVGQEAVEYDGWQVVKRGAMLEEFCLRGQSRRTIPYSIYRRRDPLPRAYVRGATREQQPRVSIEQQLRQMAPREAVFVDADDLGTGPRQGLTPAKILIDASNRVVVEVSTEFAGYLVLSDAYCLGWTAEVDGQAETVRPVNFGFRGVPLRPGKHRVEFSFEPLGLRLGATITGLTLFWVLLLSSRSRNEQRSTVLS